MVCMRIYIHIFLHLCIYICIYISIYINIMYIHIWQRLSNPARVNFMLCYTLYTHTRYVQSLVGVMCSFESVLCAVFSLCSVQFSVCVVCSL